MMQSFAPGETTQEQAYEIGMKLAEEVLGGKYEFVLATHIDRGHIHNHIIFNDVNFVDYHRSHINKKWYYNTRKINRGIRKDDKRIGLLIDIQNCIKAQESRGYEHWAKINNIKQLSKTLNFISDNGIETYEELEAVEKKIISDYGKQR